MSKKLTEAWMDRAVTANSAILRILQAVAESGEVTPLDIVLALRYVPGYEPKEAKSIEAQWFGGGGFPTEPPTEE